MKKVLILGMVLAMVALLALPISALAAGDSVVGNKVGGTMGTSSITVTAPGDVSLGSLGTLGINGPIQGGDGSVKTTLATNWTVKATAAVPATPPTGYVAGAMSTSGGVYLTEPLSISSDNSTYQSAATSMDYGSNPTTLHFWAEQTISTADVSAIAAGSSLSIEIVFTGHIVN